MDTLYLIIFFILGTLFGSFFTVIGLRLPKKENFTTTHSHCDSCNHELKLYEKEALVYKKNSTSTIFANNFMNDIEKMKQLKKVIVTGCCTDICVLNLAIPLINYFDELDRQVEITVIEDAVETYDAPYHNRDEYNQIALKLMRQAGIGVRK